MSKTPRHRIYICWSPPNLASSSAPKRTRQDVERRLNLTLAESNGILPRESWIQFLRVLGGREPDAEALLKDQETNLSVEEFLNITLGPKADTALQAKDGKITVTDNLRNYFERHYCQGGEFQHPDYELLLDADLHTWMHRPTGIQVWRDAIDLTSGDGGRVFFHYTSEAAFRNITAPSKKAAEVWASLNSDPGPKQNAWWGKGIYSVPLPPDQWRHRDQLLDNNFRNMMARDAADPDKGPSYVQSEYPNRVAFCVPIIIDPVNAFDISVRPTPEMQAAGKEPGRNLGDKLLNEPGKPPRCCVVLRVSGEDGVKHAQGQLLDALRRRAASSAEPDAKYRVGWVLMQRGLYEEALPMLQEVLEICESKYGPKSRDALASMNNLASLLQRMGRYSEAVKLQQKSVEAVEAMLGPEHRSTLIAMHNLASALCQMGNHHEALELDRKALEIMEKALGAEHPDTLGSLTNLSLVLHKMGKYDEAAEVERKALEIRQRTLGPEHPETLGSMSNLGIALTSLGNCTEAENLLRKALKLQEQTLGPEHPDTLESSSELAVTLRRKGQLNEALELQRRAVSGMETILGPDHPGTQKSRQRLEDVMQDLGLKEVEED